jgi:UDP-N-acetylmuramoyl-tripeptide--D-alanyl-D-alanine ligase
VQPRIAIITTVEPAHLEFFPSVEAIADAKAEIFEGMDKDGIAILNRDNPHFDRLAAAARRQGLGRIVGFGEHADAEARLLDYVPDARGSRVSATILGERVDYHLAAAGRHWAINSLAALTAAKLAGARLVVAAAALANLAPLKGRGQRLHIHMSGGAFELIDESYNASPAAVRAAFAVLGQVQPGAGGRRIAVLGDMRELGPNAAQMHAALAADLQAAGIDLAFTAGPLMAALNKALPAKRRGAHAADSNALVPAIVAAVRPGDVVLVKGSLGSRMGPIVDALKALGGGGTLPRAANCHH